MKKVLSALWHYASMTFYAASSIILAIVAISQLLVANFEVAFVCVAYSILAYVLYKGTKNGTFKTIYSLLSAKNS